MRNTRWRIFVSVGFTIILVLLIGFFAHQWLLLRMWQSKMFVVAGRVAACEARNNYKNDKIRAYVFVGNVNESPAFTGSIDSGIEVWEPAYIPTWFLWGEICPDQVFAKHYSWFYNAEMRRILREEHPERNIPEVLEIDHRRSR